MEKQSNKTMISRRVISFALALIMMFSVIGIMPEAVSAADFTIAGSGSPSVTITDEQSSSYNGGTYHYIKFKAKATGYVTFTAVNGSVLDSWTDGKWALCNDKKQLLSPDDPYNSASSYDYLRNVIYGVQKGKTYYLRVYNMLGVVIKANFKKVAPAKSGTKKSKAKTIKKGKTIKGVIPAGSKKSDWYKFKLSKSQYVKLSWSAKTNKGIKISVYEGKQHMGDLTSSYTNAKTQSTSIVEKGTNRKIRVPAGTTYYVQVSRYDTQSSGYYTFKWK